MYDFTGDKYNYFEQDDNGVLTYQDVKFNYSGDIDVNDFYFDSIILIPHVKSS
jgi:hypothetical protein